ncbi:MAG TPA: NAD-dependent 4,6-dehydratase LegB [Bacteroidia bacterium]|jgi:NAD dependent epimerase/dehydratase|nr:NAD-dependent 4,6-dehydratase LegB [Bacteroidia bacterium]
MNLANQRILVTGADGFIGSHLVETLLGQGAKVRALSYYNSFNYWGWLEDIKANPNLEIISGDIRDNNYCLKITEDIDIIFHLAALIAIPYSYVAPDSYVDTNIKGTLNICQAAIRNKCKKVIHTSTSEVYGTAQYVPIDEKHPLQPQSPYSASKIGADAMAMSFYNAFNLPMIIARPFNTYGPRQSARAIIPTIISQIASGKKEIEIGDVIPTRDFNYVKDTCSGFIQLALSNKAVGETVNIGSNTEISIGDLFEKIKKLMNSDVKFIVDKNRKRPEKSEVFRLVCNNSKIKELTGYKNNYDLDKGLTETIKWFLDKENLKKYKTNIYNV